MCIRESAFCQKCGGKDELLLTGQPCQYAEIDKDGQYYYPCRSSATGYVTLPTCSSCTIDDGVRNEDGADGRSALVEVVEDENVGIDEVKGGAGGEPSSSRRKPRSV
jgi:hypothetical protein